MPEEDGYWLIDRINSINQQLKNQIVTIALTVAARDKDRNKLITAGYDGHLAKPFILEDLSMLISKLISQKN